MSKVAWVVVVCTGVLALSVSASASAATAGWMVNGTILSGSAALATTAAVDQEVVFEGGGVEVACAGRTINSIAPEMKSSKTGVAGTVEFTGCSASEPCKIANSIAKAVPVLAEATLEGVLAVVEIIKPETGTIFTTIKFEGSECGLSGTTPIKGQVRVLEPTGQDERTLQLASAITTAASNEFLIGNSAAEVSGSALFRLANGQSWSFL